MSHSLEGVHGGLGSRTSRHHFFMDDEPPRSSSRLGQGAALSHAQSIPGNSGGDPWYAAQPVATAQDAYALKADPAQDAPELNSGTDTEASSDDREIEEDWTDIAGLSEAQAAEQIFCSTGMLSADGASTPRSL